MFDTKIYEKRRALLKQRVGKGKILLLGNQESPINYRDNCYHFRQDSTFLYYTGLSKPGLHLLIDVDKDVDVLFGEEVTIHDIIWTGHVPSLKDMALSAGIEKVASLSQLSDHLIPDISYLPPYRAEHTTYLATLLGMSQKEVEEKYDIDLAKAIIAQRLIKTGDEIKEMRQAVDRSYDMHKAAMAATQPSHKESILVGKAADISSSSGASFAYPPILTTRGEVLHNHDHHRVMKSGDLVLADMGCESDLYYAGDITRTWPVDGQFTTKQKEVYSIVLDAYNASVAALRAGVFFKDVHLKAANVIASGLKDLGIIEVDPEEAVALGAHTIFFPHGLGHMIGLDVHDMENIGEDLVGYTEDIQRDMRFGFRSLRLGKELEEGHTITIEPGIYFIPDLINLRKSEKEYDGIINYHKLEKYHDLGGIRIEDNYLITKDGSEIIGNNSLPREPEEVAQLVGTD